MSLSTSSSSSSSSSSPLSSTLVYGSIAATVAGLLVNKFIRTHRVSPRKKPCSPDGGKKAKDAKVIPKSSSAAAATSHPLHSHEREAGLLERWYFAQPIESKRAFVQAIKVRGPKPSLHQLQAALSYVALAHPMLLLVPRPDGTGLASQVVAGKDVINVDGVDSLAFPLRVIKPCVSIVSTKDESLDDIFYRLINQPPEVELTPEQYAARHDEGVEWSGLRLILVEDDPNPNPTDRSRSDTFTLVIRLAHVIGDGLSGMILLRHLIAQLHRCTQAEPSASPLSDSASPMIPSHVPLTALTNIAHYPSMDDLLDYRPTLSRVIEYIWSKVSPKLPFTSIKAHSPTDDNDDWYCGKNLVSHTHTHPDAAEFDDDSSIANTTTTPRTTGFRLVHIPRDQLTLLQSACKSNSTTLHGLITVACAYATAVLANQSRTVLKSDAPFAARRFYQQQQQQSMENGITPNHVTPNDMAPNAMTPNDIIGNHLAAYSHYFRFDRQSRSTPNEIWQLSRSYLTGLDRSMSHSLESVGMLTFVDPHDYIRSTLASLWHQRSSSFLVSNLGQCDRTVITNEIQSKSGYQLLDAQFLQPVHYQAAVFTNNVVSTSNGGMSNMITYPEKLVSKKQITKFINVLLFVLHRVTETGGCSIADVYQQFPVSGEDA